MNDLFKMLINHTLLICLAIALALLIHEMGHYIAAKLFGKTLKFKYGTAKLTIKPFPTIHVPRFTTDIPKELTKTQERIVALSGFGLELLVAVLLFIFVSGTISLRNYYILVSVLHLILYSRYAGDSNDFKAFRNAS